MVSVRKARFEELELFADMETGEDVAAYINPDSLAEHRKNFMCADIIYLVIENSRGEAAGFFILAISPVENSVEFRRVVITRKYRGIGQSAIT